MKISVNFVHSQDAGRKDKMLSKLIGVILFGEKGKVLVFKLVLLEKKVSLR